MTHNVHFAALLGTALMLSPAAYAQATIIGAERIDDRIEDIEEEAEEEFEESRDRGRFGFEAYPPGFSGSISATGSFQDGNTEETDVSIGGRLRYGVGPNNFSFGVAAEYGEFDDDTTDNNIFVTGDYNRYVNEQFYVFGLGRYEYDEFGPFEHDAFVGAGPGWRVVNQTDFAWRVQAGPGVRWTEDPGDNEETELAGIAASYLFYEFNETTFVTNDTELLHSDVGTQIINDAAINFRVTEALTTRVSYRTDWNSDPLAGFEETDNELRFAVVYSFN